MCCAWHTFSYTSVSTGARLPRALGRYPWLLPVSDWEEGVLEHPPLIFFFAIGINDGAARRCFCHSCLDNLSAPFLKIFCPSHLRSGHQVRLNDPTSNKFYNCVTATVAEIKIWNFQDLIYYQVPTTCISRTLYIGDLRWGQFRDLPIISQWGKTQVPQMLIRSVQIVRKHARYAQLGYCWWSRCNFANVTPRKVIWGHIMTSRGQWTFLLVTFDWIEIGTWDRWGIPRQIEPDFQIFCTTICDFDETWSIGYF